MIRVNNLTITTLKGRCLIDGLTMVLNSGDKLAIIGEEGNGKSTLLKAIYNNSIVEEYCHITGSITKEGAVIGFLEQKLNPEWNALNVWDYFLRETPESDSDYEAYNNFQQIETAFKKFDLETKYLQYDTPIGQLSGGERVKLQLARLWISNSDAYFLDEPTNDLDIETLEKLEEFIKTTSKPVVFISHDETLLENVANRILHIEQLIKKSKPKFTLEKCSYNEYTTKRARQIDHQTQMAYSQRREKEKKEEILRQIKQKVENALVAAKKDPSSGRIIAKKMANIKAQERRNENEELIEIPSVEEAIKLVVDKSLTVPSQKRVLDLEISELRAGEKELARNIELHIKGAERVAIVGKNGCGKSTLIRKIVLELTKVSGLSVGYFSQNYDEMLDFDSTPVEELLNSSIDFNPRTLLGSLKFTKEEMEHKVRDLSEGQKAKLLLMKLIIEKNNCLVLDEPTRNLSPLSNPAVRKMLNEYNGVIISVSHDRKFISEVCQKVYLLNERGLQNCTNQIFGENQSAQ